MGCLKLTYHSNYTPNNCIGGILFGQVMPNRHGNDNQYRYGFQGQERDDEIKGAGNSYTAQFWEYDPRIGRRWNIDPVVKPHRSPYDAFSNNPIIMIDPKGDDDFFNADGTFSHSTKKGNNIYVKSNNTGLNIPLTSVLLNTTTNEQIVKNVINYYAKQVGVKGEVELNLPIISKPSEENPAFTFKKKVFINVSKTGKMWGGKSLFSGLDNIDNLKSVLFHEKLHQDDEYAHKNSDDKSFEGLLLHVNVYTKQIENTTFDNTTNNFKKGAMTSLGNYFENALNKSLNSFDSEADKTKVLNLMSEFNQGVGKKRGYQFSAEQTSIDGNATWIVKKTKIK